MSHSNTVLSQLLNLIDRHDFQKLENEQFRPQRKYRSLTRWSQFTAMMFAQITGRESLRDITDSLQTQSGRLYHLGINSVKRSTLADANNRRPAEFFQALFENSYQRCAALAPVKKNIKYKVVERRPVLKAKGITSDQTIILTGPKASECPIALRRVGYKDPDTGKHYFFLTNNFHLAAKTIADIYKDRWQIELFFKWLKQNLKIKTFLGTCKNAVMTQIWVALITMLILAYMKFLAKLGKTITQIQRLLQLNLFKRQSMWELFDPPLIKHKLDNPQKILFNIRQL